MSDERMALIEEVAKERYQQTAGPAEFATPWRELDQDTQAIYRRKAIQWLDVIVPIVAEHVAEECTGDAFEDADDYHDLEWHQVYRAFRQLASDYDD